MQGKVISEIVYYYSEHIYYSEPTKNPKMQRVENDRSVEAELSDGQYRVLENSWISYVQREREKEGMKLIDLAHRRTKCDCGKSRTSYPHWPPSYRSEAVDQLCCLLGRSYPHRESLAKCWLTSLFRRLALEGTEETEAMITLVQNSCPVLRSAGEMPRAKGRRVHRIDCDTICKPAITYNDSTCICDCGLHREECPVHSLVVSEGTHPP
jgi:hypothetical protein